MLCEHLEVSPSGHLQHPQRRAVNQRKPGGRTSNDAVLAHIKAIHAQVKGKYSWPRVTQQLVVDVLRMAWFQRRLAARLAVHLDRGSQCCGHLIKSALRACGIKT